MPGTRKWMWTLGGISADRVQMDMDSHCGTFFFFFMSGAVSGLISGATEYHLFRL